MKNLFFLFLLLLPISIFSQDSLSLVTDFTPGYETSGNIETSGKFYSDSQKLFYETIYGDIYEIDGTPESTIKHTGIWSVSVNHEKAVINGELFFYGYNKNDEKGIFKLRDGQAEFLTELNATDNAYSYFYNVNEKLVSVISDGHSKLFVYDQNYNEHQLNSNDTITRVFYNKDDFFIYSISRGRNLELWKTDGTLEGTAMFHTTNFGLDEGSSGISHFTTIGQKGYFVLSPHSSTEKKEVWETDFTQEGTVKLADIDSKINIHVFGSFNNHLYYTGYSFISEQSPFILLNTDTKISVDLSIDSIFTSPTFLTSANDKLYFRAISDLGEELWVTDGTSEGTSIVKDISTGPSSSYPSSLYFWNDKLFFTASTEASAIKLWTSDGTKQGTNIILEANAYKLHGFNEKVFFFSEVENNYYNFWTTDGTAVNTDVFNKEINKKSKSSYSGILAFLNDELYFSATDSTNLQACYKTKGDAESTVKVLEKPFTGIIYQPIEFKGFLYYISRHINRGVELWRTNGTIQGTTMIKRINSDYFSYSRAVDVEVTDNYIFYSLQSFMANQSQILVSDGTFQNTKFIGPKMESYYLGHLYRINNSVFYTNKASDQEQIWKTDGVANALVTPMNVGSTSTTDELLISGNSLYFSEYSSDFNRKILKKLNALTGQINILLEQPSITYLAIINNVAYYYSVGSEINIYKLKNGQPELLISEPYNSSFNYHPSVVNLDGKLLVRLNNSFYISDGTPSGTQPIPNLSGIENLVNTHTHVFNGSAYTIIHKQKTTELWKTIGTDGTSEKIFTFPKDYNYSQYQFLSKGNRMYVAGYTDHGFELMTLTNTEVNSVIQPNHKIPNLALSPNPTTDYIKLNNWNNLRGCHIQIINYSGETLQTGILTNDGKVDVQYLPSGVYIIKVISEDNIHISNFIKI